MCGRYAMALRPSQILQRLQDYDMPVDDAPADEGDGAPRQSYNFAPGYHGVVYRADAPGRGAGGDAGVGGGSGDGHVQEEEGGVEQGQDQDQNQDQANDNEQDNEKQQNNDNEKDNNNERVNDKGQANDNDSDQEQTRGSSQADHRDPKIHYKLQSMKWGLVPSWSASHKQANYAATLKTINCRDDSLAQPGGMWASMKARKRCIVLAEGFYEWLSKPGSKEKIPHYVKRKDGKLMCFAGLWDHVHPEHDGEKGLYSYTIITTDSCERLRFLHDRMPVILEAGSEEMRLWLDPGRREWSRELQSLLKPYQGELEVYAVSREVGKVGNDSPAFVVPVASRENKANIANFFAKGMEKEGEKVKKGEAGTETKKVEETANDGGMTSPTKGVKRGADASPVRGQPPAKKVASKVPPKVTSPVKGRGKISATSNAYKSPVKTKAKADGSQKITKFFGNSA